MNANMMPQPRLFEPTKKPRKVNVSHKLAQKKQQLRETVKKLNKACKQLMHLNNLCLAMKTRLEKAERDRMIYFRYNLSRRMAVIQGMQHMFYEYVYMKSEDIAMLKHELRNWVEEDENSSDEEDATD